MCNRFYRLLVLFLFGVLASATAQRSRLDTLRQNRNPPLSDQKDLLGVAQKLLP